MESKRELIAQEAIGVVVDIGYAQEPNEFLANRGMATYGVDILSVAAPYTQTYQVDLNIETLPFADASIDTVTMGCTLAHVANPLRLLADINRVLKPQGILVLSSPNPVYYWEVAMNVWFHYFSKRVSALKCEEHFYDFSRYNIRACALVAGFQVTKEVGCTFALVKTPLKFNPLRVPGMAYEIVYVLKKTGEPKGFGKARMGGGVETFATDLFS